jgi:hypothetical protein
METTACRPPALSLKTERPTGPINHRTVAHERPDWRFPRINAGPEKRPAYGRLRSASQTGGRDDSRCREFCAQAFDGC